MTGRAISQGTVRLGLPDEDLVARARLDVRDPAWIELVGRYRSYAVEVGLRILGPTVGARVAVEVANETLMSCVHRFDPNAGVPFRLYWGRRLAGALKNELTRLRRGGVTYAPRSTRDGKPAVIVEARSAGELPNPPVPADDGSIEPYIATFPLADQEILRMRFVQGYTQAEIARGLGVSEATVSVRLRRLLDRLRSLLYQA